MKKTCVILGNGESLNRLPLSILLEWPSFGVNYCPHQPTYYCCVDHDILVNHHEEIYPLVAGAEIAYLALKEDGSSKLYDLPNVAMVTHDKGAFVGEHYFSGLTVVYVALKMAFYLGFHEVHLWGVDHDPQWTHYKADYPPGDIDRRAWRMAEQKWHYRHVMIAYLKAGRKIINHSNASELDEIFPRK